MSYTKVMPRGGTKYEWQTVNPILEERELAVEYPDSGIGTGLCRFKLGDGFRPWSELPYAFDGASASSMIGGNAFTGNLFQIRGDTHENWLLANPVLEEFEMVYDSTYGCFYVGDGVSRFNQLQPAGKQLIYDFGDEEKDDIINPLDAITGGGTSTATAAVSTLADMLNMALGTGIDPQPIENSEPFIIGEVSEPEQVDDEGVKMIPKSEVEVESDEVSEDEVE